GSPSGVGSPSQKAFVLTRPRPAPRGLSLLEVMLAVVLLSSSFLLTVSALPALFSAQSCAEDQEMATALAHRLAEEAREGEFASLASSSGTYQASLTSNGSSHTRHYVYQIEVIELAENLKDVCLTVSWTQNGIDRRLVLQTRVFGDAGERGRR
ncbi:MAG TPA: hypothetical protein VNO81_12015, partial [Candidatus Nitrosotenuis sp.]|nr:hypothetical protein [Candidatus Nitrosotenuis sp.]